MARKGGSTYLLIALIFFVIAFVFSLVIAILFYTDKGKARVEADAAKKALDKVASSSERGTPEIKAMMDNTAAGTLVKQITEERRKVFTFVNNVPDGTFEAIQAEGKLLGVSTEQGTTLMGEIRRYRGEVTNRQQELDQTKKELEEVRAASKAAEESKAKLVTSYDKSTESLRKELQTLQDSFAKHERDMGAQRKTLEDDLAKARDDKAVAVQAKDKTIAEKDKLISELNQRLAGANRQDDAPGNKKPKAPNMAMMPKGHVVSVFPQERRAYIDLGRKNKITAGLTFEVFDQSTGVALNEKRELRGKGTIEVINISDTTAECRITRLEPRAQILEGDLLVNAVYDPNMTFKFHVFGDFDIDSQGEATRADKTRIEAMVVDYGGILQKEITPDTDFLVLGLEPKAPPKLGADENDPEKLRQKQAAERKIKEYGDAIKRAQELSIPILNQNRFLGLTGYYRR